MTYTKGAAIIDNELVQGFTLTRRELLGIVDASQLIDVAVIENHGGGDHRPRPRAAPGFIDTGHERVPSLPELIFVIECGLNPYPNPPPF